MRSIVIKILKERMQNYHGELHSKMIETIDQFSEYMKVLNDAHSTMLRYQSLKIPVPGELYSDIRDISIDILEFLDYADSFSMQSTHVRCIIQNYLELCDKKGLYGR
jgi:hypothetical protein